VVGEFSPGTPSADKPPVDRLDSWKEIAAYLSRDVTTVQRWEKREGMPVHRHLHDKLGSVYALKPELDAWQRGRNLAPAKDENTSVVTSSGEVSEPNKDRLSTKRLFSVGVATLALALAGWLIYRADRHEYFWHNPIAGARFQTVTDFEGVQQSAAVTRDGQFAAFLSDRGGQTDVWVTQLGSGEFHNLTHGTAAGLVNPLVRCVAFSPDGSLVTFWSRKQDDAGRGEISVWAVPTLGGEPRPYLQGVAEFDWSRDGSRLTYHTSESGDPLYISDGQGQSQGRPIFTAPAGLHSHFPLWAPDGAFVYFVYGALPDKLDIWRIAAGGGTPERMTTQSGRITYPVLVDRRTLLFLAADADGAGPWIYSLDTTNRSTHRLTAALDRYTSLAASADGRRLVVTRANPKSTLWRLTAGDSADGLATAPSRISLTSANGASPRLGPNYLLYVSASGPEQSIWKSANGSDAKLWSGKAQILGGPAVSPDGQRIAFSAQHEGQTLLYVMRADGIDARPVGSALEWQGPPAWAPDGKSIIAAANDHGAPHLFRVPADGGPAVLFVNEYALEPAWAPDGHFLIYSGADIGTTFAVKAVSEQAGPHPLPALTLTRGGRHLVFVSGERKIAFLRGDLEHKDVWLMDLQTGAEQQVTNLPADFEVRDFDISADGHELVFERVQDHSDVVLLDLPKQ
jgi:Tol biopolymer transport system component